jgi:hypothetical protein
MSFVLLAADWPNTSLQAAIKEGIMSSSPMEYGFLRSIKGPNKCTILYSFLFLNSA